MKTNATLPLLAVVLLVQSSRCFGQGSLTPPGSPAPTQKSLQEIWDRIGTLETTVSALETTVSTLESNVSTLETTVSDQQALIQQQNALIDSMATVHGVSLPWTLTTVDSTGNTGRHTSLAFTPGGQPAISYYTSDDTALRYAELRSYRLVPAP